MTGAAGRTDPARHFPGRRSSLAAGLLLLLALVAWIAPAGMCAEPEPLPVSTSIPDPVWKRVLEGEDLFRAGRFEEARAAFRAAAAEAPQWVVPRYYLAYVDYKLGDFEAARRGFVAALGLDPEDGWSRYMLALTLAKLGDPAAARAELEKILGMGPEAELRETTLSTLDELGALPPPAPSEPSRWALSASAAVGVDTNPAYLADRVLPDAPGTSVDALLRGAAEYRRPLSPNLRLFAGGEVYEQALLANRQDADWTALSAWLGLSRPGRLVSAQVEYTYGHSIFGGDPYLEVHALSGTVEIREATWTATRIETSAAVRIAQRSLFGYLDSRGISFAAGQVFSLLQEDLVITLLYAVVRDGADDFSQQVFLAQGTELTEGLYRTNYSFLGHGPLLSARGRLPFELHLSFHLGYLWKDFDDPDILASTGTMQARRLWSKARSDTRLALDATLSRRLDDRWSCFMSFSSLDNASTLGEEADDFVDRNYARRLISVGLRYTFP